ncbi:MAG: hypothetical protein ACK5MU_03960 [Candidatus Saccharimonadales bacterium]
MSKASESILKFFKTIPGIITGGAAALGIVGGLLIGIVDYRVAAMDARVGELESGGAEQVRISKKLEILVLIQADISGGGDHTGSRSRQIMQLYGEYVKDGEDQYMAFEIDQYRKAMGI